MKALALEANGRLVYQDVPRPTIAPDECLLAVRAAGVCSSDIPRAFAYGAYRYPLIMGHEFAGEIVACGAEVKGFMPGQAAAVFPLLPCFACPACQARHWVYCRRYDYYGSRRDGAFADYIAVKAWNLLPLPEGCDVRLAALCEPLAVCIHTLKAIPATVTGRLAIVGAGFMGLCLAKLAQGSGQFDGIWLLDRNQFKLDIAAGFGFQTVLLPSQAVGGYQQPAFAGAFNVVIEACGAVETYRLALALCAHGGHVIWMGNIAGDLVLPPQEVSSILRREITIQGVWNSNYQPGEASDWSEALAMMGHETWLPDLISHRPGLSEGKAALEALYAIKQKHYPHEYLKVCFQL